MYTEDDIITPEQLDEIDTKIYNLRQRVYLINNNIPAYEKVGWGSIEYNVLPFHYSYLNNMETGIYNLGKYYFRPYGWQDTKTWAGGMSFSYRDVNRWITDLNLIEERLGNESNTLFPSDTLYPSETLLPH